MLQTWGLCLFPGFNPACYATSPHMRKIEQEVVVGTIVVSLELCLVFSVRSFGLGIQFQGSRLEG